jgi:hypothetical protein
MLFGTAVDVTQTTSVNGSYQFTNVAPGSYSLRETQPDFFQDGVDSAGSQGGGATNDVITVGLPENVNATNYNFGEVGRQAPYVGIRDLFASNKRPQLLLVVDTTMNLTAYAANSTWMSVHSPAVSLSSDQRTWNVTVQNGQQSQLVAAFPNRYSSAFQVLGSQAGKTLLRIVGRLTDLPFQIANNGGDGEGESAIDAIAQHVATSSSNATSNTTSGASQVDSVISQWAESAASAAMSDFAQLFASNKRK